MVDVVVGGGGGGGGGMAILGAAVASAVVADVDSAGDGDGRTSSDTSWRVDQTKAASADSIASVDEL